MSEHDEWEPASYTDDPMADAVYNVAAQLNFCGMRLQKLLYAFKYSEGEGMSIAEAIETAGNAIAGPSRDIASALESVSRSIDDLTPPQSPDGRTPSPPPKDRFRAVRWPPGTPIPKP